MEKEGEPRKQEGRQQTNDPYILPNRGPWLTGFSRHLATFYTGLMFDKEASSS